MKGARIILGMIILIISCALLIWGLLPARREIRSQPVSPNELQLPTPTSFFLQPTFVFYHPSPNC